MQRSTNRILTTHCGSLARPSDLLDLMKAKVHGEPYDHEAYASGCGAPLLRLSVSRLKPVSIF